MILREEQILQSFAKIKIWRRGDERAPHKPLLLLYALARLQQGERWLSYAQLRPIVGQLLTEFGPPRQTTLLYPFQYLETDGFWTYYPRRPRRFTETALVTDHIFAGFTTEVYQELAKNRGLVQSAAKLLLEKNFPASIQEDIATALNLDLEPITKLKLVAEKGKKRRDPAFRDRVLQAYEYRCAVCGFDVRLGLAPVALEAAHIKWHQFSGPDLEVNGLALCSLHHKLFDRGAFTLEADAGEQYVLRVSQAAHGSSGFDEWLLRYHDQRLREPQSPAYLPKREFAGWHLREVFKGEMRYSG